METNDNYVAAKNDLNKVVAELSKIIKGQPKLIFGLLVAFFCGIPLYITGPSGAGKTHAAKNAAKIMGLSFARVQVTPDLLDSDVVDVMVYDQSTGKLTRRKGPISRAQVVLIDEVNRGTDKTQNALLPAFDEDCVVIDGESFPLLAPHVKICTGNPTSYIGTEEDSEALMDRTGHWVEATLTDNCTIESDISNMHYGKVSIDQVLTAEDVERIRSLIFEVAALASQGLVDYISTMIISLRGSGMIKEASSRAGIDVRNVAGLRAVLERGSNEITEADVDAVFIDCVIGRVDFENAVADKAGEIQRRTGLR